MPECNVTLTHCVVYLSLAPKSNALYKAYEAAKRDAQNMLAEPVPLIIRNAPTQTRYLRVLRGGVCVRTQHPGQADHHAVPAGLLLGRTYYHPTQQGSEARAAQRLEQIKAWKAAHGAPSPEADKKS